MTAKTDVIEDKPFHNLKTLFPTDSRSDWISFEFGAPSPDLLPTWLMQQGAIEAMQVSNAWTALQYGPSLGDHDFRARLAGFLATRYGTAMDPKHLAVTAGASQSFWNCLTL